MKKLIAWFVKIWIFLFGKKEKIETESLPYTKKSLPELSPQSIKKAFMNPIYLPRRGKFKGYMRENRKCSFNKNK